MPPRAVSAGIGQLHPEKPLHQFNNLLPVFGSLPEHHQAEVAQNLGRLSLAQQHADASRLEEGFFGLDSRHRVEQFDVDARRLLDEPGSVEGRFVRGAVDQFASLVAEPHGDGFDPVLVKDPQGDQQLDVAVARAHRGVVPEVASPLHRDRDDAEPVQGGRRALPGRRLPLDVEPGFHRLRPEGDCLDGGGLAAVVRSDKYGRMAQLDALGFPETLEVADLQVVEQPHAVSPAMRRSPVSRGSSARRSAISGTRSSDSTSASARTKPSA